MTTPDGIRKLTRDDLSQAAQIHQRGLPNSPFVQMGDEFLREIYYPSLLEDDNTFCLGYSFDSRLAGFICGSADPGSVIRRMIWLHFFHLPFIAIKRIFQDPRRIGLFWRVIRTLLGPPPQEAREVKAQLLSFAVDEPFRSADFYQKHRIKIANLLFEASLEEFRKRSVKRFKVMTNVKIIANIFYRNRGMKPAEDLRRQKEYCFYVGEVPPA